MVLLMLFASSAHAYVGPGLGLGVIGAIFGAVLTVLLAIFGVFWYPIKRMLKKKKNAEPKNHERPPQRQNNQEKEATL